jgi:glycosyltransferase involved in cell wall biosynthesis
MEFDRRFLRERTLTLKGRYIHTNPDIIPALRDFSPHVIVTTGLNPTHLWAFAYAWLNGIPHVPMTDGTDLSEHGLSRLHKLVRRVVYSRSMAFISSSDGGQRLFESYGAPARKCYRSCLCTDNDAYFSAPASAESTYDLIFCSRMVPEKRPMFALDVATRMSEKLNRPVRILFVGSGKEENKLREAAAARAPAVISTFHGFAKQAELPMLYRSAKVFLFPTLGDAWGVVANEACAASLPVIVSPHAGAAGELVIDGENGFVCQLDIDTWAQKAIDLVSQPAMRRRFSQRSRELVASYSFERAATGIVAACRHALNKEMRDDPGYAIGESSQGIGASPPHTSPPATAGGGDVLANPSHTGMQMRD